VAAPPLVRYAELRPANERQRRALGKAPAYLQSQVWLNACRAASPGRQPTARQIEEEVQRLLEGPKVAPETTDLPADRAALAAAFLAALGPPVDFGALVAVLRAALGPEFAPHHELIRRIDGAMHDPDRHWVPVLEFRDLKQRLGRG
jgi:hypothetical protein